MKKILFMINSMGVGGAEKSLSSLLNLFDYQRYDVYLQMINRGGTFEKLLPPQVKILPSIPYFQFCGLPLVKQLTAGNIRFLKARLAVSEQLRKNDRAGKPLHATQVLWNGARNAFDPLPGVYDVAIAWGQGTPTHFVAEKVNAAKKIAWVNADYEGVGFNRGFDREIYGRYDYIPCVSEQLSEKFREVFPEYAEKVVTVYDINSEKLIRSMAEEPADLPSLHGTVITTVGRLVTQKGYDIAIEAARILKEQGADFTWMVCGEGPERKMLEEKIGQYGLQKDFILLGVQANPYPYMKAGDIYVQTSRFEGYCLTLTEARILNRPCVATNFDVVYDQMVQGENGLVVEMAPEAVAEGILRLMRDPALYAHIRQYQQSEGKGNEGEVQRVFRILEE